MSRPEPQILVTDRPLVIPPPDYSAAAGGVVDFHGVVRGREEADAIAGIMYEAHVEMAEHQMTKLAHEAVERFPLLSLLMHHRIGFVPAAEASLFLRVSAAHRGPAFEAAEWLIIQLKLRVPIWKNPVRSALAAADADALAAY